MDFIKSLGFLYKMFCFFSASKYDVFVFDV